MDLQFTAQFLQIPEPLASTVCKCLVRRTPYRTRANIYWFGVYNTAAAWLISFPQIIINIWTSFETKYFIFSSSDSSQLTIRSQFHFEINRENVITNQTDQGLGSRWCQSAQSLYHPGGTRPSLRNSPYFTLRRQEARVRGHQPQRSITSHP